MSAAGRALSAARLVHPVPSLINTALVYGLAALAGGEARQVSLLAAGMLGLQFCIGAVNDLCDVPSDRAVKPWKPLAAGVVSRRAAWLVALVAGGGGLMLATAAAGGASLAMAAAMLACGLIYDVRLKPTAWAWLCFSAAFAVLPVYAWYSAAGQLPPRSEFVLPLAALAGPVIALSNGLADLERDRAAGLATLVPRLGRRSALLLIGLLLAVVHGLAWLTLPWAVPATLLTVGGATSLALLGLLLSAATRQAWREGGWMIQACALALLGWAWLSAVA